MAEDENLEIIEDGGWIYRLEIFEDEGLKPRMAWGCHKCGFSIKNVHDKAFYCPWCGTQNKEKSNGNK